MMPAIRPEDSIAILLVAGMGRRLGNPDQRPKVLLEFGGKTLLERHLLALRAHGVGTIALTVGYGEEAIRREVGRLGLTDQVRFIRNSRYQDGSLVSLWAQREALRSGSSILLMDGDVLCGNAMISRLFSAEAENLLLVDRDFRPGDEPVKICFRDGRIVDFRKMPEHEFDWCGESVGFFRFSAAQAAALADACSAYMHQDRTDTEYEEAIRDLILAAPDRFTAVDVSDLPWTEIDFGQDVDYAREVSLPKLENGHEYRS